MPRALDKERIWKFVEAYAGIAQGNQAEAARIAGYKGNTKSLSETGRRLLKHPDVMAALEKRRSASPLVMTKEHLQIYWSDVVGDPKEETINKLRASQLLAKSLGMFTDRQQAAPTTHVHIYLPDNGRDPPKDVTPPETIDVHPELVEGDDE
jgi:phage terminase small subunit